MSGFFNAGDITEQILEHISHRGNTDTVNLIWTGYVAALMYGDSLDVDEFFSLLTVLKPVGRDELRELFSKFLDETEVNDGASDFFTMFIDVFKKVAKEDGAVPPEECDTAVAVMRQILGMPQGKVQE